MSHLPDLTKRHYLLLFMLFDEYEGVGRLPGLKPLARDLLNRDLVEVETRANIEERLDLDKVSVSIGQDELISISLSEKGRAHCLQLMSIPLPEERKTFRSFIHNWSWSSEDGCK